MKLFVWAYSESDRLAGELSNAGHSLATASGGEMLLLEIGVARPGVLARRKLVLRASSSMINSPEMTAEAIFRAAKRLGPSVILVGASRQGREVAARLAAKLGRGCLSEVFNLSISNQMLTGERNAYAGRVLATTGASMPCIATVMAGAYPQATGLQGSLEEFDVGEISPKVKVVQTVKKGAGKIDLKSAKLIVSAGRGVKKKEDLSIIEELARSLGGAIGCSRPLSSDLGWLPEEHHIGLTGASVRPDLYLAIGISGQLQHIAGIKDSRIIAAINSDRDAPIFQAADYGVVGDLYQVVPAIQRLVAARKS